MLPPEESSLSSSNLAENTPDSKKETGAKPPLTNQEKFLALMNRHFTPPRTPILGANEPEGNVILKLGDGATASKNLKNLTLFVDLALAFRMGALSLRGAQTSLQELMEVGVRTVDEPVAFSAVSIAIKEVREFLLDVLPWLQASSELLHKKANGFGYFALTEDGEIAFKAACRAVWLNGIRDDRYFARFEGW